MSYDRSTIPDLSEVGGHWDSREPANHSGEYVAPGRLIARVPGRHWRYSPQDCPAGQTTEWILDGRVLLCTGCGLDVT